jgi:predicted transcriptional regulator
MILKDIKDELEASVLVGQESLNLEVKMVCGADLLSDVLAFTKSGSLFLTGLTHPQVIRTAEIAEIAAICFVRGRQPSPETIGLAEEKGVPILCTALPMYESCGRLYRCGLGGCSQVAEEQ